MPDGSCSKCPQGRRLDNEKHENNGREKKTIGKRKTEQKTTKPFFIYTKAIRHLECEGADVEIDAKVWEAPFDQTFQQRSQPCVHPNH